MVLPCNKLVFQRLFRLSLLMRKRRPRQKKNQRLPKNTPLCK